MSRIEACNVQDFILSASALSTSSLDLSRKGITELPLDIPGCNKLECLYLEGNRLTELPESLFTSCPNLRWLDLRNNRIETLPPSIDKLKVLRTLLLEGNRLKTLPPQLGRLRHLTGLNLSRNPLDYPPKHVVEQGTKAVLRYLCELLSEPDEDDNVDSCDSTTFLSNRPFEPLHPIENNHGIVAVNMPPIAPADPPHSLHGVLPLPLMRQATLHSQEESAADTKRKHTRPDTPSPHHSPKSVHVPHELRKKLRRRRRKGIETALRKPVEHTAEEKMEINTALEKQKSKRGIESWRQEARAMQRQQELRVHIDGKLNYPKAVDTAPFGTENNVLKEGNDGYSETEARFKAMDAQRETLLRHGASVSSLRDARESEVSERINVHMTKLAEQRRQAGIINAPSSVLLEAEKRLAEAIARRKEFEDSKVQSREYRLTAFTGDDAPF